jgi:hypothetical protein
MSANFLQAAKPAGLRLRDDRSTSTTNFPRPADFAGRNPSFNSLFPLLATGVILASATAVSAQNFNTVRATPAQALVDTSGINTHLTYGDTAYTNWAQVFPAIRNLGVKHIRDGYWGLVANDPIAEEHRQLAQAGITTDYVISWGYVPNQQQLKNFIDTVWDAEAVESPNECDVLSNCGGGGTTGVNNVVALLPSLHSTVAGTGLPLMGPSFVNYYTYPTVGNLAPDMSLNSMHLYFGGRNPGSPGWGGYDAEGNSYGSLAYWQDMSATDAPGIAPVITETGYMAWPSTSTPFTLPESVEASYIPRTLLLAFQHGYQETFFYQLIDDPTSPAGYGLLNADFSPKPAYTALKNLISLMSDPGGNFSAGTLNFNISGGDSNLQHMLFQKSNGDFYLVLWLEEPSYNTVDNQFISVTPENIGIELPNNYKTETNYQFNNTGNYVTFNQPTNNGWASLTVTDQISIIKIVPTN